MDAFYKYEHLQDQAGQDHIIARPRVITYQELEERCQALEGYQDFREASNKKAEQDFRNGISYQSLAIQQIQRLLEFLGDKEPMVVIGLRLYYPSMNCRFLDNTDFNIVSLITDYREYLDTELPLKSGKRILCGVNDTGYCALEKDVALIPSRLG